MFTVLLIVHVVLTAASTSWRRTSWTRSTRRRTPRTATSSTPSKTRYSSRTSRHLYILLHYMRAVKLFSNGCETTRAFPPSAKTYQFHNLRWQVSQKLFSAQKHFLLFKGPGSFEILLKIGEKCCGFTGLSTDTTHIPLLPVHFTVPLATIFTTKYIHVYT